MGLDVTVDYTVPVRQRQRLGDLYGEVYGLLIVQPALLFNDVRQGLSFHQFHNDVMDIALLAYIVYSHYVGMCKSCCSLGFSDEVLYEFFVPGEFGS